MKELEIFSYCDKGALTKEFVELLRADYFNENEILVELIRVDATRKLLQEEQPELLQMVESPSVEERLFKAMQKASERVKDYLFYPEFRGDSELFHRIFNIFSEFSGIEEFLWCAMCENAITSYFLPEGICNEAFANAGGAEFINIVGPEAFLGCLFPKLKNLKPEKTFFYLSVRGSRRGGVHLISYMLQGGSDVEFLEEVDFFDLKKTLPAGKRNYLILHVCDVDFTLKGKVILERIVKQIERAPEGTRFFILLPRNFFSSFKFEEEKRFLASFEIEKIYLWDRRISPLGAVVFTRLKRKEYETKVFWEGNRIAVESSFLQNVPLWTEATLFGERKEILKFFLGAEKVRMKDVAQIRLGDRLLKYCRLSGKKAARVKILREKDLKEGKPDFTRLPEKEVSQRLKDRLKPLKAGDVVIAEEKRRPVIILMSNTGEEIYPEKPLIVISPENYPSRIMFFFLKSPVGAALLRNALNESEYFSSCKKIIEEIPLPVLSKEEGKAIEEKINRAERDYENKLSDIEKEFRARVNEITELFIKNRRAWEEVLERTALKSKENTGRKGGMYGSKN